MSADQQHAARLRAWEAQLDQQQVALRRLEAKAEADSQRIGDEVAGFLDKLSQEAAAAQQHNKNMAEVEAALEERRKMKRLQELCHALVAENKTTRDRVERLESTCLSLQKAKESPVHALQEEVFDLRERLSKLELLVPHLTRIKPEPPSCTSSDRHSAPTPVYAPHLPHLASTAPNSPRMDWRGGRPAPPLRPSCQDRTSPDSYGSVKALGKPPLPDSMMPPAPRDSPTSLATPDFRFDGPAANEYGAMSHSAPMPAVRPGLGPIMRRVSEVGSGESDEDKRVSGAGERWRGSEAGSRTSKEGKRVSGAGERWRVSEAGSRASDFDDRRVSGRRELRGVSEAGSVPSYEHRRVSGIGELRRGSEAGSVASDEHRRVSAAGESRARSSSSPPPARLQHSSCNRPSGSDIAGSRRTTSSSNSSRPSPALPQPDFLGVGFGSGGASIGANVRLPKRMSWGGESMSSRSSKVEELPPKVLARSKTHRLGAEVRASNLPATDNDHVEQFPRRAVSSREGTVAGEGFLLRRQGTQENEQELMNRSTEAVHREALPDTASQVEKLRANAELYCATTHKRLVAGASRPPSARSASLEPADMGGKVRVINKREASILSGKQSDTERVAPNWRNAAFSPWVTAHARTTPANSDDGLS